MMNVLTTDDASVIVEIKSEALAIPERAQITVVDNATMLQADNVRSDIKAMIKKVDEKFKPIADKAFQAHRGITGLWKEIKAPLEAADQYLVEQVKRFQREERDKVEAEQRRLQEIARKEAEEKALADAIAAEQEGNHEEAQAIIEEKPYVPPIILKPTTPKVDQRVYGTVWKARVTSKALLIKFISDNPHFIHLVDVNQSEINGMAKSQKSALRLPGVESYEV
jgi:hypothetical protein